MTLDTLGLFLHLAGFVIGLGAVTVIDLHGFLGRNSQYWTEATIRTHKVTKPLIWLGIVLVMIGGALFFREYYGDMIPRVELLLYILLIVNGCFLSFWVSPRLLEREAVGKAQELLPAVWQRLITVSFLFSVIGWWGSLVLTVLFLSR